LIWGKGRSFMETLQRQIDQLNRQIETLNGAIENLTGHISELMADKTMNQNRAAYGQNELVGYPSSSRRSSGYNGYYDMMADNKDILMDGEGGDTMTPVAEKTMSPELQIQRLTAQLTAAYNRIAALEEQLLSRRMVSS
jgi:chaperonin cofactor prefoldin